MFAEEGEIFAEEGEYIFKRKGKYLQSITNFFINKLQIVHIFVHSIVVCT